MDIQYYGANCIKLTTKTASVIIDDTLGDVGLKSITKDKDIGLFTSLHGESGARIIIDSPGEYEVSDISIRGVAARAHIDENDKQNATMYRLIIEDIKIAIVGHIYPDLDESQLESLGTIDILIVPVGGNGYTLDAIGAHKVIRKIDPKLVIPTHYSDPEVAFPVPQQELSMFLSELSVESPEPLAKLKVKPADFSEAMQISVLERQ